MFTSGHCRNYHASCIVQAKARIGNRRATCVNSTMQCSRATPMNWPNCGKRTRRPRLSSPKPTTSELSMSLNHRGAAVLTAAALAAFFCAPPAFAQTQFEEDFDDAGKTWQEIAVQLPAA